MRSTWRHYWISLAVLTVAAPLPTYLTQQEAMPLRRPLGELAYTVGGWRGRDLPVSDRVGEVLGTKDILVREYINAGGQSVGIYVSFFPRQQRGEISHSPRNCLPGAGWQPLRARRVPYPLAGGGDAQINEVLYEREGRRQLVFYWFRERDRILASEYRVKWYLLWDAVTRRRTDGALLRVSAPVAGSEERTRQACIDFMRSALPPLNESFPS
jgi:EpsI family protein